MKIVYLVHQFFPEYYTGTERFVLNLARMVQKAGDRIKVITYSFYEDSFYDQRRGDILWKEFLYMGIPVLALRHKDVPHDIHHAIGNAALAEVARELIAMERADMVHVAHTMRVGAFAQALKPLRIPYIVTLTDFFLACPKVNLIPSRQPLCNGPAGGAACERLCTELESEYIHERLRAARDLLDNARLVVAPSAFVADVFMREFPALTVRVVHHGLSFARMKTKPKSYTFGDRVVFGYAGSFNPHKGTHLLIEAFGRLNAPNAQLRMYGSAPDASYEKRLRSMVPADANIDFRGIYSESETGDILSDLDVVVVPSLCYENYPMTLHEALACNIPVIATRLGGMAERIKEGVNGFLFELGDSRQLENVLGAIVKDPAILNPLKQNINRMMIQGIEQEAYAYARAYRRLCSDRDGDSAVGVNGSAVSSLACALREPMVSARGRREDGRSEATAARGPSVRLLPPDELIREHSGGIDRERFISMGDEIVQNSLIEGAKLRPSHRILDVGCGCGKLARALTTYLSREGSYDGIDIGRDVINWCKERYETYSNFRFHWADLRSDRYNPAGAFEASKYRFPFPNKEFDVVFAGSVFTHMMQEDMDNYVGEIARVMKRGGICLATYFVLDAVSRENIAAGLTSPAFAYEFKSEACRVDNPAIPEAAIAYDEGLLRDLYGKHGLSIERIVHGEWGRSMLIPHSQDEVWSSNVALTLS